MALGFTSPPFPPLRTAPQGAAPLYYAQCDSVAQAWLRHDALSETHVLFVPRVARKHRLVQAPGPGATVILLTFLVLAQGGGWTAQTARGGTGHLGRTETQRGRLWTACGQRCVDSKNSQTTPATTSTSSIRQLLGAADTQTAHPATSSTSPAHQRRGSANAEATPAGAPAAAADRTQRPDATCEGKNG